jgi:hypothetical protein
MRRAGAREEDDTMGVTADRLAHERQLNADARRLEAHAAKMDLLRLAARYEHVPELAPLWPVIEQVVTALAAIEATP